MRELAVANGVPREVIVLEEEAANTLEMVRHVSQILERQGRQSILLVSSPYHMRRATLTWSKIAPRVAVIPSPVPQSQFYAHGRGASFGQIRGILHEYAALAYYWYRGWL